MECLSKIWVHTTNPAREVPCKKCIICKMNDLNSVISRGEDDMRDAHNRRFITLTYTQDALVWTTKKINLQNGEPPKKTGTLVRQDLKTFLDNLNKRQRRLIKNDIANGVQTLLNENGKPKLARYIAAGEYGERKDRPHYHVVMWGIHPDLLKQIEDEAHNKIEQKNCLWQYGSIQVKDRVQSKNGPQPIDGKGIRYSLKYILEGGKAPGREPTFRLWSKALGKIYLEKQKQWHRPIDPRTGEANFDHQRAYRLQGKKRVPLSKYIMQKIFTKSEMQTHFAISKIKQEQEKQRMMKSEWPDYSPELQEKMYNVRLIHKVDMMMNRQIKEAKQLLNSPEELTPIHTEKENIKMRRRRATKKPKWQIIQERTERREEKKRNAIQTKR